MPARRNHAVEYGEHIELGFRDFLPRVVRGLSSLDIRLIDPALQRLVKTCRGRF